MTDKLNDVSMSHESAPTSEAQQVPRRHASHEQTDEFHRALHHGEHGEHGEKSQSDVHDDDREQRGDIQSVVQPDEFHDALHHGERGERGKKSQSDVHVGDREQKGETQSVPQPHAFSDVLHNREHGERGEKAHGDAHVGGREQKRDNQAAARPDTLFHDALHHSEHGERDEKLQSNAHIGDRKQKSDIQPVTHFNGKPAVGRDIASKRKFDDKTKVGQKIDHKNVKDSGVSMADAILSHLGGKPIKKGVGDKDHFWEANYSKAKDDGKEKRVGDKGAQDGLTRLVEEKKSLDRRGDTLHDSDSRQQQRDENVVAGSVQQPQTLGDRLLDSLGGSQEAGHTVQNDHAGMEAQIQEVCDRVLVSHEGTATGHEVRIQLKENVIPGTEVRLRMEGGKLSVQLVTNDAHSYAMLNELGTDLASRLNGKLPEDCVVHVEMEDGKQQQFGQSNHQDQGRSKEQRNLYDEMNHDS
ncbi:type III secretion HpaP family protein [Desulfovibrio inopinatus]|uniref:type III secretion HpaP family protein n=1 Tax=Desulfovibrio inopinatus TaxID=102109 RepID=UPI0004141090|nr:type III secretion HpaP family protein [Desulfovibrio inopinatus]